jgi:hypothetical protein
MPHGIPFSRWKSVRDPINNPGSRLGMISCIHRMRICVTLGRTAEREFGVLRSDTRNLTFEYPVKLGPSSESRELNAR